jgi:large subunit ribosomal protein L31
VKDKIHPKYYPEARVTCACGNTWVTGSTKETIRTDVCSKCHPFFTGQLQRLVDTAGQVDRFTKRFERAQNLRVEVKDRAVARAERARARALVEIVDEEESIEPIEGAAEDEAKS